MEQKQVNPYQILFFLGILSGILGVSLWFFFKMRWISFFPGPAHGHLMFSAFLWPFIAGFLMTAIPRMTNSSETHFFELFLSLLFIFLQWVLNLRNLISYSEGLYFFQILFLGVFVLRRILSKRMMPFEGFVFLPFAFIITIFILLSPYFLSEMDSINVMRLSGEVFVLNLIVGLGSRLVPILSRVPIPPNPSPELSTTKVKWLLGTALLLNTSFVLELFKYDLVSFSLRALVMLFVAIKFFEIYKRPTTPTYLGMGLRISIFLLFLGYLLQSLNIEDRKNLAHLVYIGGFSLLTLLVATRVRLAHGGFSLDYEIRAPKILMVIVGLLLTTFLRLSLNGDYTGPIIILAVLLFSLSTGLWLSKALEKTSQSN